MADHEDFNLSKSAVQVAAQLSSKELDAKIDQIVIQAEGLEAHSKAAVAQALYDAARRLIGDF